MPDTAAAPEPALAGDKYDVVVLAIRECNAACAAYNADRWRWLPWRDRRHAERVRAARWALIVARAGAGMRAVP